jgi:hypothetical protein
MVAARVLLNRAPLDSLPSLLSFYEHTSLDRNQPRSDRYLKTSWIDVFYQQNVIDMSHTSYDYDYHLFQSPEVRHRKDAASGRFRLRDRLG